MDSGGRDKGAPGPAGRERIFIIGLALGSLLLGAGFLLGRASAPVPAPWDDCERRTSHPPQDPKRPPVERAAPDVPASAPAEPDPVGSTLVIQREVAYRSLPDHGAPLVGRLSPGVAVRVLEVQGEFYRVARPSPAGQPDIPVGWILWGTRAPVRAVPQRPLRGVYGDAVIAGVVHFTGRAPEMKVPKKRAFAEVCKDKPVVYNAVVVSDGRLQDVLVRLSNDSVKGDYEPPHTHARVDQIDCMYAPRVQGVVAGQSIDIWNDDRTLHNVHTYKGVETWFNAPQPKGADPLVKEAPDDPAIVRVACDVHPWMRGFVVVSSHPFFSVTGAAGAFSIERVPAGTYTLEAWHPHYGLKTAKLKVEEGQKAEASFTYDGTEAEPPENKDELKDLF